MPIALSQLQFSIPTYLIKWAETTGKLEKLIIAAYNKNSGNPELKQFYAFFEKQEGIKKQQEAPTASGLPLRTFEFETVTVNAKGDVIRRDSNKQANFFEEDLDGGVKLKMVSIPGGSFNMGSGTGEKQRQDTERPSEAHSKRACFFYGYVSSHPRTVSASNG